MNNKWSVLMLYFFFESLYFLQTEYNLKVIEEIVRGLYFFFLKLAKSCHGFYEGLFTPEKKKLYKDVCIFWLEEKWLQSCIVIQHTDL